MRAAIVTCGGLCPGTNVLIREIVMALNMLYGTRSVYGIQYSFKGFYTYDWIDLNPEKVKDIHRTGGTILGTSEGEYDVEKIVN